MKTIEQHFCDWESGVFGYGYGSGEEHTMGALKAFLAAMNGNRSYDYQELEAAVTPAVAWLLINTLAHDNKIEYGTSPRFGWLTKSGLALAQFMAERDLNQLCMATDQGDEYIHCYVDHCNCDDGDCRPHNPFWQKPR
jgi:hypothetical protein